ncbi:MAG: DUF2306 domain-containing protein [Thermoanaerobaculia bacterium]|nr:DUF2306 domain-containing protein [Thermoanaerobaculia bacterium]
MRRALVWSGLIVLVGLGVISAVVRVLAIAKVKSVTDARLVAAATMLPDYAAEIPMIEQGFADNPSVTLIHVTTGGLFLMLGLLQFSPSIRNRHRQFHRWSGRFLVGLAYLSGVAGIWLGVVAPYSPTERAPTAMAGVMFLITPIIAVTSVRRGNLARHREWMIRFFAVGVGIVVIRIVGPFIIWFMSPTPFRDIVGLTFWAGWIISVLVAEVWIRRTRARQLR